MATRNPAAERQALLAAMTAATAALLVMSIFYFHDDDSTLAGDVAYAVVYLVVDLTNRTLGPRAARRVVYAAALVQSALFLINVDAHNAVLAGSAVLWPQLLNVWIFDRLRRRAWWQAPLLSTAAASVLDSLIYTADELAFGAGAWLPVAVDDLQIVLPLTLAMVVPYWLILRFVPPLWRDTACES